MKKMLIGTMMRSRLWALEQRGKLRKSKKEFLNNERGDTNFVAIIVIIVIILAIAVIFRDRLQAAVEAVFGQLDSFIGGEG